MMRLLTSAVIAVSVAAAPAYSHEKIDLPVSRQDSGRLKIIRAWAEQHHDKVRLHGWVRRPFASYAPVNGRLRVEAWSGSTCVAVRHTQWSQLHKQQIGTYSVSIPTVGAVSNIRISHVGWDDPETCPVAHPDQTGLHTPPIRA